MFQYLLLQGAAQLFGKKQEDISYEDNLGTEFHPQTDLKVITKYIEDGLNDDGENPVCVYCNNSKSKLFFDVEKALKWISRLPEGSKIKLL